jgi:hypothetical protein
MADSASLLAELGRRANLGELSFDSDGACSLCFDDRHDLTIARDQEERALFLYGTVGQAGPETGEAAWRRLLAATCLGAETGGAGLGMAEDGLSLILWKRHDDNAFADYADFESALNQFLGHMIAFQERLPDLLPGSEGEITPSAAENLNTVIRV